MKTIFFYLIVLLSYISVSGYGSILNKKIFKNIYKNDNFFELLNFVLGVITLSILGYLFFLLSIKNIFVNLGILILGLFLYFIYNKNIKINKIFINSIILIFIFTGLIISKTHEDFIPYHFPFIEIITNSDAILGMGKIEINYVYTPLIAYLQKIFVIPYLNYKLIHVPIFLLYFSIILFLTKEIFFKSETNLIFFFILIFFLTKFTRLSEYGYDYVITFLITIIFIIFIYEQNKNEKNFHFLYVVLIFVFSLTIKNISVFFIPIMLSLLFLSQKNFFNILITNLKNQKLLILIFLILIIVYITEGFLKSGCIINFIIWSCVENDKIFWSVDKQEIIDISNHVKLWAKGFYHQDENLLLNLDAYSRYLNWVPNWYRVHFNYKVLEFLGLLTFIFVICYFLTFSKNKIKNKINYLNKLFLLSSIVGIFMWFLILPQLRFGAGVIIGFYILLLIKLIGINDRFFSNKKIILSLVITSFIFFNIKNVNRINDEFKRLDKYQFKNFPFVSVIDYASPKSFNERYRKSLKKRFSD